MDQGASHDSVPIVGVWKLISFEIQKADGEVHYPFGEQPEGFITYTEAGRMSVQMMRPNRPHFSSGDMQNGSPEEIKAAFNGFSSYYGPYVLDGENGFVVHQIERALFPNWDGRNRNDSSSFRAIG